MALLTPQAVVFSFVILNLVLGQLTNDQVHSRPSANVDSIYVFNATDINGKDVSFEKYRSYVLLVVNVASECGLTETNYRQLNELYTRYMSKGLQIAAFPCNQFAGQEPGDEVAIKQFVAKQNVQFDVYTKVDVNGENTHAIFKWLKSKLSGILFTEAIKWNFTKFLIDCYGQPVKRYGPLDEPKDIESDLIEELERRTHMLGHTPSDQNDRKFNGPKENHSTDEL